MKSDNTPPQPDNEEDKFPNTYQIVEMLKVLKQQHADNNRILADAGRHCDCCHWKEYKVSLEEILDYIYEQEGLDL